MAPHFDEPQPELTARGRYLRSFSYDPAPRTENRTPAVPAPANRIARLDPATPVPPWPRAVRLGVDYSLRVSGMDPQTDAEADSLAYACFVLGNLAKRDPPGDPPATCSAQERARAGGLR